MADDGEQKPRADFIFSGVVAQIERERAREEADRVTAERAAARRDVSELDVEFAREEYLSQLSAARETARSPEWNLNEEDRIVLELYRSRYEALATARRERTDEQVSAESRELAKTNVRLAKSQTLIAGAVALFTLVQVALAVAQAMKWIK